MSKTRISDAVATPQRATASARFGQRALLEADVTVSTGGLLAVGALVAAILLSTAVLVRAVPRPERDRTVG